MIRPASIGLATLVCSLAGAHEARGAAPARPRIELLDRSEAGPNDFTFGFDAPNERAGFWSQIAASCSRSSEAEADGEGPGHRARDCRIDLLSTRGGYEYYSFWEQHTIAAADGTWTAAHTAIYARAPETDEAWHLFDVGASTVIAHASPATELDTPTGPLPRVPLHFDGTGNINHDFYFRWTGEHYQEIDCASWLDHLDLPPEHAIWKGVVPDLEKMEALSMVWKDGDGNCAVRRAGQCGSGSGSRDGAWWSRGSGSP